MGLLFKSFFAAAACLVAVYLWIAKSGNVLWRVIALILTVLALANLWHGGQNINRSALFGLASGAVLFGLCLSVVKYRLLRHPIIIAVSARSHGVCRRDISIRTAHPPLRRYTDTSSILAVS